MTAAQAVHWFDFHDKFYAEARRVLAPGGAIAVFTYNLARASRPISTTAWIDRLARETVGPWWAAREALGGRGVPHPVPSPSPR